MLYLGGEVRGGFYFVLDTFQEEEKARVRKDIGMGVRGDSSQSCLGDKLEV